MCAATGIPLFYKDSIAFWVVIIETLRNRTEFIFVFSQRVIFAESTFQKKVRVYKSFIKSIPDVKTKV